ncbi:MAG: hypothetical protein VX527_03415 [Planctomycetota bacterium]|nr:hypothetical protein [Planctomycetota bacterium]
MQRLLSSHRSHLFPFATLAIVVTSMTMQAGSIPCDTLEQDLGFDGNDHNGSSGYDMALDGDIAVVQDYNGLAMTHDLYFYYRNQGRWSLEYQQTLADTNGMFIIPRKALDVSGDTVIASSTDYDVGHVGIYRRLDGDWTQEAALDGEDGSLFGLSVAISNDVAVIGQSNSSGEEGEAHVYRRNGDAWEIEDVLRLSLGSPDTWFGTEVAVDGNTIMVSALSSGAWVFEFDGDSWNETQHLQIEDMQLGGSIDLDGDVAVLGSYFRETDNQAVIFRYHEGEWTPEQSLVSKDLDTISLGHSVRISGNIAAVVSGEFDPMDYYAAQGKVHVFRHDGEYWEEIEILEQPTLPEAIFPMPRVGLSGQQVAVGYINDELLAFGQVAIYTLTPSDDPSGDDCNLNDTCDELDIASGTSQDQNSNGVPDECECPDTNSDGVVDASDVLAVIAAWGDCKPDDDCPEDVDSDGTVGVNDILLVIGEWGKWGDC